MSSTKRVCDLGVQKQAAIRKDIATYLKSLGHSETEVREMVDHVMSLTLWELSDSIDIRKYI